MTDLETKEKILKAASMLFADKGFEGTSVREIARSAEVNVASVNYYFSSKENLFQEILKNGYQLCSFEMKGMFEKNKGNLEETLVDFLKYFFEHSDDLMTHFKMMMSSQHSHSAVSQGTEDAMFGPPGGNLIAEALKKLAPEVADEDLYWALKTLFSHVVHLSLIHTCCLRDNKEIPFSTKADLEKSVRRVTRIVIAEIKSSLHKTSNP